MMEGLESCVNGLDFILRASGIERASDWVWGQTWGSQ